MFTPAQRLELRNQLVEDARADERIAAAAIVGSAALDREDEWSDIDLALRVDDDAEAFARQACRDGLALRPARAVEHRPQAHVAGRVHAE